MARHLDLDALRAARGDTLDEGPTVLLFGDTYTLPPALPFAVIEAFAVDDAETFRRAVVSLIGEDGLAKVIANGATSDDMRELLILAAQSLYGAADPEA